MVDVEKNMSSTSTSKNDSNQDAEKDVEAQLGSLVAPSATLPVQDNPLPPPRTPSTPSRLPLAPRTPMLDKQGDRPDTATKPQSRLEKLRTVAYVQIAKAQPGLRSCVKFFYNSSLGVILTRIDWWLEKHISNHKRYFGFLVFFQLFPFIYFIFRLKPTIRRKCDEPLDTYIIGSGLFCFARIVVGYFVMVRMSRRDWIGQSFGEGLGQVMIGIWNMQEKQGYTDDGLFRGFRLNVAITLVVVGDVCFWMFGFITICVSQSAICATRITVDASAVLAYQFFNVFFFSAYLDVIMPYFNLEFDPDVDVMVSGQKNSTGDMKRKMKISMEKKAREAERLRERMRRRAGGQPKVIQVAPSSNSGGSHMAPIKETTGRGSRVVGPEKGDGERPETAWWAAENGMPPRKAIVTNKVLPGPETDDKKKVNKKGKKKAKL